MALIAQLQAVVQEQQNVIAQLQRRIEILEGEAKPGGPKGMPGIKPKSGRQQTPREQGPRKPRPHGFARRRTTPTHRVEHALESCPQCGTDLSLGATHSGGYRYSGGSRSSYRTCLQAPYVRNRVPKSDLGGAALGKQRLGVAQPDRCPAGRGTVAPPRSGLHQLSTSWRPSTKRPARPSRRWTGCWIRASPVVHAERPAGGRSANGYVWTFSTPTERYFRAGAGTRRWWTRRWAIPSAGCW